MTDDIDAALNALVNSGWHEAPPQAAPAVVEYPPLPTRDDEPPAASQPPSTGHMTVGLLTDLAVGRTTAVEAAQRAGITERELEDQLATTLREVDPKEIAKAMGIQAAQQQLKSGAIYGAVIADLVNDMVTGRLKPEQKIELAKLLARVGRVEPKEDKGATAGGGFVLNIQMGASPQPVIIDSH